jgi:hypothetical protein
MMESDHDVQRHSQVPRGVPGAGWLIAAVFALAAIVFGNSWWQGGHGARGAPPASDHTSGVAR